jgi:hypothetical protein
MNQRLGKRKKQVRVTGGRPPPRNTEMFGPMVEGFSVVQWCPTRDGSGKPEAVALVSDVRELGDIVMRLKSRDAVNQTIAALEEHRDAVFGPALGEPHVIPDEEPHWPAKDVEPGVRDDEE